MNWTGSRLQQDLSSGTLGRDQKQRFARAKLKRTTAAQANPALQDDPGGARPIRQVSR